ncbi:hypothetical protein BG846_05634 [Streptomyces fradiae ATCC 10745 = DSM 40063]|uniref:Uncharacterized protein n=1 Tax=Streptomyces fradiae ATCC 10745 = DSM 40063 TaxID=1319510 RepID=A0A1Y2NNS7_STRFR|nr:hypothetical protein BG846_05634 [Streptomyces fradiae ATCC 10745 = DSM 40063]
MVDAERVGLPARPVQGDHQQGAQRLAQRVLGDQGHQLADGVVGAALLQAQLQEPFAGAQVAVLQGRGGGGEGGAAAVGEDPAPVQAEGALQGGGLAVDGGAAAGLVEGPVEADEVELFLVDDDPVARSVGDDHFLRVRNA